ncbi:hypothetical protein H8A97_34780 [Bradyrhizobium sp. Arg62]|uniref:hypothetical protein n=2 Tax=Bradyrhizobium TaxID=374 RepID=UPI001E45CF99|nr:hypothetical protein [Bradyrhizobium ivorense]MCC8940565.1 hypothetical protein [Bradyrhizobium ivorense]MCC8950115.1 hypothetical protein [Bradyrhizobium brasilense]
MIMLERPPGGSFDSVASLQPRNPTGLKDVEPFADIAQAHLSQDFAATLPGARASAASHVFQAGGVVLYACLFLTISE